MFEKLKKRFIKELVLAMLDLDEKNKDKSKYIRVLSIEYKDRR